VEIYQKAQGYASKIIILCHNGGYQVINGIVFRGEINKFKLGKIKTIHSDSFEIPFDKTLFVENVKTLPVDLMPAAWHFLDRWDMAVPLWRYGVTAADVGTKGEREETCLIVRDLRVLLHSYELLFVRKNEAGIEFMQTWERECSNDADKRLAFLRAFYIVKPKLCVLPISWLAEVQKRNMKFASRGSHGAHQVRPIRAGGPLVKVELEPGRFVKCHKGDEERVIQQFSKQRSARGR
jgi:hypothetical protein